MGLLASSFGAFEWSLRSIEIDSNDTGTRSRVTLESILGQLTNLSCETRNARIRIRRLDDGPSLPLSREVHWKFLR